MLYTNGRVPAGEQTFGYSNAFVSGDSVRASFSKPIAIPTMIRLKPVSNKKSTVTPYGPKNQRP